MVQSPRRNTIVAVEPNIRRSNPFDARSRPSSLLLSTSPSSTASTSSSGPTTPSSFLNFTDLALPPGLWDQDGKTGYLGEPQTSLPSQEKVSAGRDVSYGSDVDFWLDKTGTILVELLHFAKYPQEAIDQHYAVLRDVICPALGPRPAVTDDGRLTPSFPSFMCDGEDFLTGALEDLTDLRILVSVLLSQTIPLSSSASAPTTAKPVFACPSNLSVIITKQTVIKDSISWQLDDVWLS